MQGPVPPSSIRDKGRGGRNCPPLFAFDDRLIYPRIPSQSGFVDPPDGRQQILILQLRLGIFHHMFVTDDPLLVNDEICPLRQILLFPPDIVFFNHFQASIAQEREREIELLGKELLRDGMISTYAQDLGFQAAELLESLTELGELFSSDGGKIQRVERHQDVGLSSKIAQRDITPGGGLQSEIGRRLPYPYQPGIRGNGSVGRRT